MTRSKRSEKARDAAVECCRALRQWIVKEHHQRTPEDFSNDVYPYLMKWMRHETNQKYEVPTTNTKTDKPKEM